MPDIPDKLNDVFTTFWKQIPFDLYSMISNSWHMWDNTRNLFIADPD